MWRCWQVVATGPRRVEPVDAGPRRQIDEGGRFDRSTENLASDPVSITLIKRALKTDLPAMRKMVLVSLASFMNEKNPGSGCWPSMSTLVHTVGATDRTIQGHILALENAGHIDCLRRKGVVTYYFVHPIAPRKSFGGRRQPTGSQPTSPTPETSSPHPRSDHRRPPEDSSDEQESTKNEKGEPRVEQRGSRSKRPDRVAGHLAQSPNPMIRKLFK